MISLPRGRISRGMRSTSSGRVPAQNERARRSMTPRRSELNMLSVLVAGMVSPCGGTSDRMFVRRQANGDGRDIRHQGQAPRTGATGQERLPGRTGPGGWPLRTGRRMHGRVPCRDDCLIKQTRFAIIANSFTYCKKEPNAPAGREKCPHPPLAATGDGLAAAHERRWLPPRGHGRPYRA